MQSGIKSGIKYGTEVTLNLSSNVSRNCLILINTQILRLHKANTNNLPANIKLSKTHLHKIGQ